MHYPAVPQSPLPSAKPAVNSVPAPLIRSVVTACYVDGGDREAQHKAKKEEGPHLLALSDTSSPETVQTLAAHLTVLQALFLRFSKEAVEAKRTADIARLAKAALQAQERYTQTVALIAKLNKLESNLDTVYEASWR